MKPRRFIVSIASGLILLALPGAGPVPLADTAAVPVANDDSYSLWQGATLTVTSGNGVLQNDTDADGDPLTASSNTPPANGTLNFGSNGAFTYDHDGANWNNDSFTYHCNDGFNNSNIATVNLSITRLVDDIPSRLLYLIVGPQLRYVPYDANHSLYDIPDTVTRAVVVVHGTNRNANDYYNTILIAATNAGNAQGHTLIVAPQFLTYLDIFENPNAITWPVTNPFDLVYWTSGGWKEGDESANPGGYSVSSFDAMDEILETIAEKGKNVRDIIVTGHSAGGQFTNRYAAGNDVDETLREEHGVRVRYVIANPSTYLYLNDERWTGPPDPYTSFGVPANDCTPGQQHYDHYKYGLQNRNPYMNRLSADIIRSNYRDRRVMYLMGELDVEDGSLDQTCAANLQGIHRYERGQVFMKYLKHYYVDTRQETICHEYAILGGVEHDADQVYATDEGRYALFDYGDPYYNMVCGFIAHPAAPLYGRLFIGQAVAAAPDNWCVELMDGTYYGSPNRDIDFNGKKITVTSWSENPSTCVMDCQGQGRGFNFQTGEGYDSVVKGIKIKDGTAVDGGGIRCSNASPAIHHCAFYSCRATGNGGGVYANGTAYPDVVDCEFNSCSAVLGGGLYCNFSSTSNPAVNFCSFVGNRASTDGGGFWGSNVGTGIYKGVFLLNGADNNGGAIYLTGGSAPSCVCFCAVLYNWARNAGAAVYLTGNASPYTAYNSYVGNYIRTNKQGDPAAEEGPAAAIAVTDFSQMTMNNCIVAFSGNAGAISTEPGTTVLLSCSNLYGNSGGDWNGDIADQVLIEGNFSGDPCFCNADSVDADLHLCADSYCLPGMRPWGCEDLVGALGEGCDGCGCMSPIATYLAVFSAQPDGTAVRFVWQVEATGEPAVFRLSGRRGDREWTVPYESEGGGRYRALDPSPPDGAPGAIVYSLHLRQGEDRWLLLHREEVAPGLPPLVTRLEDVHPNPFNPQVAITYALAAPGPMRLAVFDLRGNRVMTLVDGMQPAGRRTVTWNGVSASGAPVGSGAYVVRFEGPAGAQTRKILLVR
ncbi:cadherin-like domain-containing protein [bacterium]|nr:cadherin-like domain-containing protein [bacterium]MBU1073474.1 cadherin-like domain-containing protein [bacterium]MBU1676437.1 cadherin-like domain-containing protein [bacterium]